MPADDLVTNTSRRSFFLFSISVLAGLTSFGVSALRFLRPRIAAVASENWVDIGPVSELRGDLPIPKKISSDQISGWAVTREERLVYLMPGQPARVMSAVCPHEGCEVAWERDTKRFSCPCHESYFAADGSRLTGPARRGLDALPTRVQGDKIQVQYQQFQNNTAEQIRRA